MGPFWCVAGRRAVRLPDRRSRLPPRPPI